MVRVVRVDPDLHVVVTRPAADLLLVGAHLAPRLAGIVAAVHFLADHSFARLAGPQLLEALLVGHPWLVAVLDVRVEDVAVFRVYRETDAAKHAARQPAGQLRPRLARVDGLVD